MGERAVSVGEPQDAEEADHEYLTKSRETVDKEGGNPADDGCFNQIEHIHNTAAELPGRPQKPSRSIPATVDHQSRGSVIGPGTFAIYVLYASAEQKASRK